MTKFETTQFANSIATLNRAGATSVIERSIINGRSKMTAGRQGGFAAAKSTISNSTITNRTGKSAAFQAETEVAGTTGLNTSRIVNRGEVFAMGENDVRMENCFFVTARTGGFQITAQNIRGIADQNEASESDSWKISNYQTNTQAQRIAKAA